jgi:hypothetical protein
VTYRRAEPHQLLAGFQIAPALTVVTIDPAKIDAFARLKIDAIK